MQQPNRAECPPQRDAATDQSFMQKLFGGGESIPTAPKYVPASHEDSNLDQRVRESGEW